MTNGTAIEQTASTSQEEGRVARRRARVRRRIVEVAERLMTERGVEGVTIDDIAEAADIARRTFYHHFESKHELLVPIARARTKSLNRRLDALVATIDDPAAGLATASRHGLREIPADSLCKWFVMHSGLPHERLYEGMGESGMRDAARAMAARRVPEGNVEVLRALVLGAFLAAMTARIEDRIDDAGLDDAVEYMLRMLGLEADEACELAHRPLSPLPPDPGETKAAASDGDR